MLLFLVGFVVSVTMLVCILLKYLGGNEDYWAKHGIVGIRSGEVASTWDRHFQLQLPQVLSSWSSALHSAAGPVRGCTGIQQPKIYRFKIYTLKTYTENTIHKNLYQKIYTQKSIPKNLYTKIYTQISIRKNLYPKNLQVPKESIIRSNDTLHHNQKQCRCRPIVLSKIELN